MKDIKKMRRLIVIGDSWTYGSEIRDPNFNDEIKDWNSENDDYRLPKIWPTKLSKMLGFDECINLSYPAASNDRTVRVLINWLTQEYFSKSKPTDEIFVIVGLTSPERKDFFYRDEEIPGHNFWMTLWPMWKHKYLQEPINKFADLYVKYFWNKEEYANRYVNQIFQLQTLFERYNIKFLIFQSFYQSTEIGFKDWKDDPYMRDFNATVDKLIWDLIDPVTFVNKNDKIHSFHNYIVNKDTTKEKSVALLDMHPSEVGHTWWSEYLFEYIQKFNIIPTNFDSYNENVKLNDIKRNIL
jgi:hypothetical protein